MEIGSFPLFSYDLLNAFYRADWLDPLAFFFSYVGEETFYSIVLPLVFWLGYFKRGVVLGTSFLLSSFINQILKVAFDMQRPLVSELTFEAQDLYMRYLESSNGFPSGHSQSAMAFFLLFAFLFRNTRMFWPALIIAIGMPLSRMYLGVHYPGDVVGGLVIGLLILLFAVKWAVPLLEYNNRSGLHVPFIYLAIALTLLAWFPSKLGWVTGGSLCGFFIGSARFHNHIDISEDRPLIYSSWVYLVGGLLVVLFLRTVLKMILPAWPISDFLRYFILLLTMTYFIPMFLHARLGYRDLDAPLPA